MPIDDPTKFVPKISASLGLRLDTEYRAVEILRAAQKVKGLSGKSPKGVAAAALYLACLETKDKRVQKHVANAAGTSEVTLRNRLKGLESIRANVD
jgi:transcription initiation factor TFIIB